MRDFVKSLIPLNTLQRYAIYLNYTNFSQKILISTVSLSLSPRVGPRDCRDAGRCETDWEP